MADGAASADARSGWPSRAFAATLAQIPLGAITVHYDLNPHLVIAHFLLAFALVALAVLVLVEANRPCSARRLRYLARLGGATCSSSRSWCSSSRGHSRRPPEGSRATRARSRAETVEFHSAVYWHVRAVAVFGIVFLALAAWAWRRRERFPWLARGCAGLLALLLAQMAVGEVQYRTYGTVPWGGGRAHAALAAGLFGWTIGLVARLWRPVERH